MAGWHHLLNRPEFKQALGDGEGQGSLECCSPWGLKSPCPTDMTATKQKECISLYYQKQQEDGEKSVMMPFGGFVVVQILDI